jgi:hypothetical protein
VTARALGALLGPFDLALVWIRGERLDGIELFEIDATDVALARLEELGSCK